MSISRVFISSTSLDLPKHREYARDACLQLGMLPVMMEYLSAKDADAVEVSLGMVEECEIYLGIFGRRYGYIPEGYDISITEMEYNRAVELRLPRFIFIMNEKHFVESSQVDVGDAAEKLQRFLTRLKSERVVRFFDSPEKLLADAISSLAHHHMSSAHMPVVQTSLGESDKFSDSVKAEMARLNKTIEKLTFDQYRVLDYLSGQRRVAITGCAGSGKTLIAMEKAIRLARAGLRTLVLCHNPYLAEYMRRLSTGERVFVIDFTNWIAQLIDKSVEVDGMWTHYYWPTDDDLLDAAEKLINSDECYDAVIVDEGQDFRDEWWLVVEAALVNPQHDILYIFHDNNQALLPHKTKYPVVQSPITLSQNCRNAGHIFDWVSKFHYRLPQSSPPELEGKGMTYKTVFLPGSELSTVQEAIISALRILNENQIVILTTEPDPIENSILNKLEVTVPPRWGWQDAVITSLTNISLSFNTTKDLPKLSTALSPNENDIQAVIHFADNISYGIRNYFDNAPSTDQTNRIKWVITDNRLQLVGKYLNRNALLRFFKSNTWSEGIPKPQKFQIEIGDTFSQSGRVRLATVSSFKGLEADGVVLFVRSPMDRLSSNLYVGLSRARFLVHLVIDPMSNSRLPQLELAQE